MLLLYSNYGEATPYYINCQPNAHQIKTNDINVDIKLIQTL